MTANRAAIRWCAVYTRKSSEEGLEQQFNSLHAQREAGEAYIKSQRHEGWRLLAEKYDDGVRRVNYFCRSRQLFLPVSH